MRPWFSNVGACLRTQSRAFSRLRKDTSGTTAIEFAMVAAPFFFFAFAIMGIGLQFFTINSLEHGVESAARKIRTGQVQAGKTVGEVTTPYTNQEFKQMVCDEAGAYIECNDKLIIHMSSGTEWTDVTLTPCLTNGVLTASSGLSSDNVTTKTGGASSVVLVTACYRWDLGGDLWQVFWNLLVTGAWSQGEEAKVAGPVVIQAVATFRTEPYN